MLYLETTMRGAGIITKQIENESYYRENSGWTRVGRNIDATFVSWGRDLTLLSPPCRS